MDHFRRYCWDIRDGELCVSESADWIKVVGSGALIVGMFLILEGWSRLFAFLPGVVASSGLTCGRWTFSRGDLRQTRTIANIPVQTKTFDLTALSGISVVDVFVGHRHGGVTRIAMLKLWRGGETPIEIPMADRESSEALGEDLRAFYGLAQVSLARPKTR